MKQANLLLMSTALALASCGNSTNAVKTDANLIQRSSITIEGRRMTPEALWAMGRIGSVSVSPNGKQKTAYATTV